MMVTLTHRPHTSVRTIAGALAEVCLRLESTAFPATISSAISSQRPSLIASSPFSTTPKTIVLTFDSPLCY